MSASDPSQQNASRDTGWTRLSSEAHRIMFFFGALQAVLGVAWWALDVGARYLGLYRAIAWSIPSMWAHAWLLLYGLFPFFMFGFLMTAGPNWLGAPKMPRCDFLPAAMAMAAGLVLFYVGLVTTRPLVATGAFVHAAGWFWGIAALLRVAAKHWNANARYALVMFALFTIGLLGSVVCAVCVAMSAFGYIEYALQGAVWFFLMPIYLGVSTRMVPFFASRILGPSVEYRPPWGRPVLMGSAIAHGVLDLAGAHAWLWIVDLPFAAVVLHLAMRWGLARSVGVRLLAVLHISLAMLALALVLSAALSIAVAARVLPAVGLAPLHLVTIGYFAAMLIGMVSRVSLGHSGRPLQADGLTWYCYIGLIATAVTRAAGEFVPMPAKGVVMALAAALWLLAFGAWAWRYVPMYVQPRMDAR